LQGVDVEINDIDILTDKDNIWKIDTLLADYRFKAPNYDQTEKYRSYYGIYRICNVKVETMAEFQYRLKDGGWSKPNQSNKIRLIDLKDVKIPVLSLRQEITEYKNGGDNSKVIKIQEVLIGKAADNVRTKNRSRI
jgi:hypothetical protein